MTDSHALGQGPAGPRAAADGYRCVMEDGEVVAVSADLARVTGRNASTLLGDGPFDLFADADRDAVRGALGRCLGDGEAATTATLAGRDDRAENVAVQFLRVDDEDGRPRRIRVAVHPDDAAPKQASGGLSGGAARP